MIPISTYLLLHGQFFSKRNGDFVRYRAERTRGERCHLALGSGSRDRRGTLCGRRIGS